MLRATLALLFAAASLSAQVTFDRLVHADRESAELADLLRLVLQPAL